MNNRLSDETILTIFHSVPWPIWFILTLTMVICFVYIITNLRVRRDKDTGKVISISFHNRSKQIFDLLQKIDDDTNKIRVDVAKNTEAISFLKDILLGNRIKNDKPA